MILQQIEIQIEAKSKIIPLPPLKRVTFRNPFVVVYEIDSS